MKSLLRVLSAIVCVAALMAAAFGILSFFSDSRELMAYNAVVLASAFAMAIAAGILWMLTEISSQLARQNAPAVLEFPKVPEEGAATVVGTRAGAAAIAAIGLVMIIVVVASVFFKR